MADSILMSFPVACILTSTGSMGVFANLIQLVLICRDKNQKSSVFGLALISLNIADLLSAFFLCSDGIFSHLLLREIVDFKLLASHKSLLAAALAFSLTSSFTHVVFIAVQRVVAVVYPLKVKKIFTKSRCHFILVLLWVISVSLAVFVYFHMKLGIQSLAGIGIVSGITLIIIYSVVCYKAKKRNILNDGNVEMQRRRRQQDKQILKYSVAITIVFVICNYPRSFHEFLTYPRNIYIASVFLYCINPVLDPLLYFIYGYCRRKREREREVSISGQEVNMKMRDRALP